jgi:hypothetical protein
MHQCEGTGPVNKWILTKVNESAQLAPHGVPTNLLLQQADRPQYSDLVADAAKGKVSIQAGAFVNSNDVVAPIGTNLRECVVCSSAYSEVADFSSICFKNSTYRGPHGNEGAAPEPRHQPSICAQCMQHHAETAVREGQC